MTVVDWNDKANGQRGYWQNRSTKYGDVMKIISLLLRNKHISDKLTSAAGFNLWAYDKHVE